LAEYIVSVAVPVCEAAVPVVAVAAEVAAVAVGAAMAVVAVATAAVVAVGAIGVAVGVSPPQAARPGRSMRPIAIAAYFLVLIFTLTFPPMVNTWLLAYRRNMHYPGMRAGMGTEFESVNARLHPLSKESM
jgi:hypothetical protein